MNQILSGRIRLTIVGALLTLWPATGLLIDRGKGHGFEASAVSLAPVSIVFILLLTGIMAAGFGRVLLGRPGTWRQFDAAAYEHCTGWLRRKKRTPKHRDLLRKRVVLLGAGPQASRIIQGIHEDPELRYNILGILDDRDEAQGESVDGVKVIGPIRTLRQLLDDDALDEVIVAVPDASVGEVRKYVIECRKAKLPVKVVPRRSEILTDKTRFRLEDFSVDDFLLRRTPINADLAETSDRLTGRRVLVTGAGGSIGSELCRQIASFEPESLVLVGHGENSVFWIHNQLLMDFPHMAGRLHWVIASVADQHRLSQVFHQFRPDLVFHAAAHKHVPVMEANLQEALQNNVLGTNYVAEACGMFGAERMVLISTDKAADPISVMGATKLLAEEVVRFAASTWPATTYTTVRFGNVLGSRGSVVPIFREQIRRGGPVSITHPDMTRYFMTIPEAVHLVLQAGALGESDRLYLLDMGVPVRILDLALDMIRLSGFEPYVDIPIKFEGVRPGEKIHEQLISSDCQLHESPWHRISVVQRPRNFAPDEIPELVKTLRYLTQQGTRDELRLLLTEMVPGFAGLRRPDEVVYVPNERGNG